MATLSDAEAVRAEHAEKLRLLGAHSIEVGMVTVKGKRTPAITAHLPKPPTQKIPTSLSTTVRGKKVTVPVVVKITPEFQPD